ncbi:MAG: hypothetical protein JXK04_07125 [Campylobacterales bacterium]|nr:hypothetical protein [Campylobacterales bacterium]
MRFFVPLLLAMILGGCMDREIYSEISDPAAIGRPPASVQVIDPTGDLKTSLNIDPNSTTKIEVYVHCAKCSSASAKALGSDFDGYVRVSIYKNEKMIARAQMDYKGEPSPPMIQTIYDTLIQKLQWSYQ